MRLVVGQRVAHRHNPKKTGTVKKAPHDVTYGILWDDQPDHIVWMADFALTALEKPKTDSLKQMLANAESAFPSLTPARF